VSERSSERFLVTGALGCIGAWVVRQLVTEGVPTTVLDTGGSTHRLRYLLSEQELEQVTQVKGDITDGKAVLGTVREHGITNLIHLAALQVPFCKADPARGAAVNVLGTVNVFEAVKQSDTMTGPVVYASSIAAYEAPPQGAAAERGSAAAPAGGGRNGTDGGAHVVAAQPAGFPATHYGVFKRANEGNARVYWADDGIPSVGLRPYVIYGVGRDQGMTSVPTAAMLAAARGLPAHIPFGGRSQFQYAADAADAFIRAARAGYQGADVFNLAGPAVHMTEVVEAITAAVPELSGKVTFDDTQLPFPEEVESSSLVEVIGAPRLTPIAEGVADTIERFRALTAAGLIQDR
jgi:UDP-glucuronate 4-epimerase